MAAATESETSTRPPDSSGMDSWEQPFRLVAISILVAIAVLALFSAFGVRSSRARASDAGYTLEVTYASAARPGMSTPFGIQVIRDDGSPLPTTVTIRIDSKFLNMFDDHQIEPIPAKVARSEQWTWWTFDTPPDGASLDVFYDGRLDPAVQWGETAAVGLDLDGADPEVSFRTWVFP